MGLDMNLSKINKRVEDIQEFKACMEKINAQYNRKKALTIMEDYSNLSLLEFLEKYLRYSLLEKYNQSTENEDIKLEFETEFADYINQVKEIIESSDEGDLNLDTTHLCYWRKHSDLNGVFEEMYYDRGGEDEFNCEYLLLSKQDIVDIIRMHKEHLSGENEIPHSSVFFWGQTILEDWQQSLKDFEKVLKETDWDNETVYYSCWW